LIAKPNYIDTSSEIPSGGGSGEGDTYYITNEYSINTSPTITTDTNGWLQAIDSETTSETGKTDMTGPIMSMLQDTGYCHLSEGIFYVSGNIVMPSYSKIEGCGFNTKIRLLQSTTAASTIVMKTHCSVENLLIEGAPEDITRSATIGGRNGIEWGVQETSLSGIISKCKIRRFDGAGILLQNTMTPTIRNTLISDCFIINNNAGIFVKKDSEFHRISNCTISANYYGYYNRGGNNNISNCGIDSNVVGILIDSEEGSNNGHGTITGCSINHSDSNTGYGLIIKDTGRMLVSNCNFYYSKIRLENTNGNIVSNCGFGQSAGWEIEDGACNIFNGCMVRSLQDTPVTIINNDETKIINCFDRHNNQIII